MRSLLFVVLITLPSTVFAQKRKVIVSYFKPFGGVAENHSMVVAQKLKQDFSQDLNLEIVLCPPEEGSPGMDVSFYSPRKDLQMKGSTSSYQQLKACYEAHPDAQQVISLGEGSCTTNIESNGYNTMSTEAGGNPKDHSGNFFKEREKIDKSGPDSVKTDDINMLAVCLNQAKLELQKEDRLMTYSNDPDDYVCNNVIYNFQRSVQTQKLPVSFSFIHVAKNLTEKKDSFACDTNPYKKALKKKGLPMDRGNFSQLITDHIAEFIRGKDLLINQVNFNKKTGSAVTCDPNVALDPAFVEEIPKIAQSLKDELSKSILSSPETKKCIKELKEKREKGAKVFKDYYSDFR